MALTRNKVLSNVAPSCLVRLSVIITLLSAHPPSVAAFQTSHHRDVLPTLNSFSCADNTILVPSDDSNRSNNAPYVALQRRLHLTHDETALIQNRIGGITPRKKDQKYNHDSNDDDDDTVLISLQEQQTMEGNLAYLEEHLDMTIEQLRRIVVGYPLLLKMKETNLKSTVEFFVNAMWNDGGSVSNENNIPYDCKRRVAAFLCESPQLLEYNVNKRLKPRLERLRKAKEEASSGVVVGSATRVDEEMLRSVATLTDSRFETWLLPNIDTVESGGDGNEETTKGTQTQKIILPPQRQPNNNNNNNNNPSSYVILSNLQSGGNIGNILRSASIFGCQECIIVGQKRYRMTGDHGSRLDLPQRHMWTHDDVKEYFNEKRVRIYGIEIMENASPIMQYDRETGVVKFPFESECEGGGGGGCCWTGSAFIFGNEGQGLSTKQREICNEFLFIPQNRGGSSAGTRDTITGTIAGTGTRDKVGSASMNVACAAAVVLQAYSMWAGYSEARFEGEKFLTCE